MPESILFFLLGFSCLLAEPVVGLAAWWTRSPDDITTPHFAYQDLKSGDILHSSCNSNGSASFSTSKPKVFPISDNIPYKSQPKFSGPIAVAGWWDDGLNTPMASVFYQAVDGTIVKALFRCDNTTGNYTFDTNGENIISDIAGMVPVDKETGLAAVRIEESGEYRVHYHGEHGWVDLLSSPNEIDWQWRGPVVRFGPENMALAAVHTNGNNVSVAWPERQANFLVAKFNEDNKNKWSIESFPRPFYGPVTNSSIQKNDIFYGGGPNYHLVIPPGFEGDVVNTSISANANSQLSVFYIGEDAQLHEYFQQTNGSWKEMASPGSKEWPEADDESGRSAAASPPDSDEMWLYYTSQDDIAELYRDGGGVWRNAKMTSFTTAKNVDPDPNSNRNNGSSGTGRGSGTGETDTTTDSSSAASFATGVKVGIGIGVSVGLLVVATATWFLLRKRRQRTATTEIHQPPELQDTGKVELSDTAKFELSDTAKFELSDTAKYELPGDTSFQRS